MHEHGVQCANRDELVSADPTSGIEHQDHETFAFGIVVGVFRDVDLPVFNRLFRGVAKVHVFWQGTVAQGDYFVFLGFFEFSWELGNGRF